MERPDFVLNQSVYRGAAILVAGANFGCGSSREQAIWALRGLGIRCIIAPSFGEIFFTNCFKNGMLPIVLPVDTVAVLAGAARAGTRFVVDLAAQTISLPNRPPIPFPVDTDQRTALLNGWDETAMILNGGGDAIRTFETRQQAVQPWLYQEGLSA